MTEEKLIHVEALRRLLVYEAPKKIHVPTILQYILDCEEDVLEFGLGKIGSNLKSFASKIDFSHPEIISIFDGVLADDQQFSQECMELLLLAKFAKENQLTRIIPLLGKLSIKDSLPKNVIRKIDSYQYDRLHVRLLKDPLEREEVRLSKKMQNIDLQSVYKGEEWDSQPDSFSKFLRLDTSYEEDLKIAEKKMARYEELGCKSLAEEIHRNIETFKENIAQSYYGFNRITLTNAAIILAKSLKFDYEPKKYFVGHTIDNKITINRSFFGKYNFDPDQAFGFDPLVSEFAGSPIFTNKYQDPFIYQPRVYPLHEFYDLASKETRNIIETLEAFPEAGGKPIFDHFGLIVPTVALQKEDNAYSFLDECGLLRTFSNKEEAEKSLDLILIKNGYIKPVVIGEKDGKCFFLSYFL